MDAVTGQGPGPVPALVTPAVREALRAASVGAGADVSGRVAPPGPFAGLRVRLVPDGDAALPGRPHARP
ncbi:hypothetical protein DFW101_3028 [Solidesulfovibrio carbinoliphilus subsp. oakridgensis]|uniref:Uncharacterized protein n=1 Tax=Solidesulfovibrio carbinoliphilus subsp. oakridgensis TaxID=694327 RepID=G7Q771_9BACT|nr:hypothetical protein [Solidesulfovibrio carbinoliphilus]EHJ49028.1 hypothetical protein DFW101_3028 [Solidesulfovibrio carbinoliphilus subsp. oakridgensis]